MDSEYFNYFYKINLHNCHKCNMKWENKKKKNKEKYPSKIWKKSYRQSIKDNTVTFFLQKVS